MVKQKRSRNPQKSLPTNVIDDEILTKLPVKSLLRCRCVSKSWCAAIDDSSFVSSHFKNCQNNQDKTHLLTLEPSNIHDSKQSCVIRSGEKFRKMSKIEIDVTLNGKYQAVSYVNGLLCMKRYIRWTQISNILLWNPSIRKAIEIPFNRLSSEVIYDLDYALGYDHVKNDYKLLTSVYTENGHNPGYERVFTLSSFSWKIPNIGRGPCLWIKDGPKVFLNGVIYWGGVQALGQSSRKGRFSHFVSFDVTNDVVKYIDLPDCEYNNIWFYERFPIMLDQSVGLMEVFRSHSQIWVMEESKRKVLSWTKRFSINLELLEKCLYFKMDGELLFKGENKGVNSYNIKTKESKVLAKSYKLFPTFICVYMESLALLKGVPRRVSYSFPQHGPVILD